MKEIILRPIGTIFSHNFAASSTSANLHPHRHTFRVIGHVKTVDGIAEEVETIEVEELPAPVFIPIREMRSIEEYYRWKTEYAASFSEPARSEK